MKGWILALAIGAPLAGQVKLPPYTRETLPNGAVVYLAPKTGLPLVDFRVLAKGGTESEPAGLAGLAEVTATLLRRGTAQRTAEQFAEELDGLGAARDRGLGRVPEEGLRARTVAGGGRRAASDLPRSGDAQGAGARGRQREGGEG